MVSVECLPSFWYCNRFFVTCSIAECMCIYHKDCVRDFFSMCVIWMCVTLLYMWHCCVRDLLNTFSTTEMNKVFFSSLYFSLCTLIHGCTLCGSAWQMIPQHRRWHDVFNVSCNCLHSIGAGSRVQRNDSHTTLWGNIGGRLRHLCGNAETSQTIC